jgi:hypothetical protein
MQVDEKLTFAKYLSDDRFQGRSDYKGYCQGNQFALVSRHFFYFGRNALPVSDLPLTMRCKIACR